jgi:ATP-dependent Lon protease
MVSQDNEPKATLTPIADGTRLPVLPLRDIVVFPHMIVPLFVGREKSIEALSSVMDGNKRVMLLTQKDIDQLEPESDDLFTVGTVAHILQLLKLPDGTVKVLIEGLHRAEAQDINDGNPYFTAAVHALEDEDAPQNDDASAMRRTVLNALESYTKLNKKIPSDTIATLQQMDDDSKLADTLAAHLPIKIPQKQDILSLLSPYARLEKLFSYMEEELELLQVENKIRKRVKTQMEKNQRDYFLNEQIKAIQKELNEGDETQGDVKELEEKIKATPLSKDAREKADSELKKLKMMNPMAGEYSTVRNYLDWLLSVPWNKKTRLQKNLRKAQDVLDEDHYGLEKVKERILEYIAVQQRTDKVRSSIMCLIGPPGVGKTSLGKSVARATGRKFVRVALGGVHDESEIRGHRRTYIGAMPGKIVQGMKKAGTSNPVFMLDEIDKLGSDFRGDPSAALLEVLDPEQNNTFNDHYLDVDYDLSDVMFICTANSANIARPLLDRMEVIRIAGYTEDEKLEITRRHITQKQMEANGLRKGELIIEDEALRDLVRYYTRESGVRSLEREVANICRKAVKKILLKETDKIVVNSDNLGDYAGVRKFRFGEIEENDLAGIVTGLAWTEVGGDLLSIESVLLPGEGKVTTTGKLGDVMKESVTAAEMLIKSRAADFGIDYAHLKTKNIHVHVPEGATPKDGPSAGIAMVTSIVSILTGIPVRRDIAMTGEITLRGRVFPIGGLKEKLLAALRGGVKTVLIPHENVKDLAEIPDNVKNGLEIIPVEMIDQVLKHALVKPLTPLDGEKKPQVDDIALKPAETLGGPVIHH